MDKQTLIIVVVAGSVVGLVVVVWLARTLSRACRGREKVPIPPPQALRHHVQTAVVSRPQTVYESGLGVPSLPHARSRVSIVSVGRPRLSMEGTTESGSDLHLRTPMDPLGYPQPSFHVMSPSSSSFHSSEEVSPTNETAESGSTSAHQRRARSQTRSPGSRTSSVYGPGLPHGSFSTVQVVLPAPLAVMPDSARSRPHSMYSNHRLSTADSWASLPTRDHPLQTSRSSSHLADKRSSMSSLNGGKPRISSSSRRSSTSSLSPSPSPSPRSSTLPPNDGLAPPVPRIPSIYNTLNYPPPDQQRGRSDEPVSAPPTPPKS